MILSIFLYNFFLKRKQSVEFFADFKKEFLIIKKHFSLKILENGMRNIC